MPASQVLTPAQQVFVEALTDITSPETFGNQTQAYRKAHPQSTYRTAGQGGHKNMRKGKILGAVRVRLERISREDLERELQWNFDESKRKGKLSEHREAIMALAKLRGDLVEKREITQVSAEEQDTVRRLVVDTLRGVPTPTLVSPS